MGIDLKGETSILTFNKDGTFRRKKDYNFLISDAGEYNYHSVESVPDF